MKAYEKDDIGVTHPATLVPKSIYDKFGAFDIRYKLSGDVDWFHRVCAAGCKLKHFLYWQFAISKLLVKGYIKKMLK